MARARLSKRLSDSDAIRLFAEHHITQVRRRKNGEIVAVKHAAFGWVGPTTYYLLQEIHTALPKIIEGGYRLKQAMWGVSISVIGTDVELPIGEGLMIAMAAKIALSVGQQSPLDAIFWSALMALPFGEIVAIWILTQETLSIFDSFTHGIEDISTFIKSITPVLPPILPGTGLSLIR